MASQSLVYFVGGSFFEKKETLDIGYQAGKGVACVISKHLTRCMFYGMMWRDDATGEWHGNLTDLYGVSRIRVIQFNDAALIFEKFYEDRGPDEGILYRFTWNGECWDGAWSYMSYSKPGGTTKCLLVPIPAQMFHT